LQLNAAFVKMSAGPRKQSTLKWNKAELKKKHMDTYIPGKMNFIMPHFSVFMYSTWLLRWWKLQNKN
jgi:hypothetical protein